LLRADFFDSDSFFENEMRAKLEQKRSARGGPASAIARCLKRPAEIQTALRQLLTKACAGNDNPIRLG
jgi:hypothetical protein